MNPIYRKSLISNNIIGGNPRRPHLRPGQHEYCECRYNDDTGTCDYINPETEDFYDGEPCECRPNPTDTESECSCIKDFASSDGTVGDPHCYTCRYGDERAGAICVCEPVIPIPPPPPPPPPPAPGKHHPHRPGTFNRRIRRGNTTSKIGGFINQGNLTTNEKIELDLIKNLKECKMSDKKLKKLWLNYGDNFTEEDKKIDYLYDLACKKNPKEMGMKGFEYEKGELLNNHYFNIKSPLNNKNISIYSKEGKFILKKYLQQLKTN